MGRLRVLRMPSPAMIVACIALAVALSGASYAAITLPKNSVGTKQIRNNAVKSNKIAPDQVTGADVNEASLGQVPSAANAASAANAGNAGNADKLDNLDSTDFLASGGKAADADRLDGADSALFQRRCAAGGIRAYALIDLNDLPANGTYTNLNDARFTCANSTNTVRAKRTDQGDYTIDFGYFDDPFPLGVNDCPRVAVATLHSGNGHPLFVSDGQEDAVPFNKCVFNVTTAGGDASFVIAQIG